MSELKELIKKRLYSVDYPAIPNKVLLKRVLLGIADQKE